MGWTYQQATHHTPRGKIDKKAEVISIIENCGHYKVLDCSMKGNVFYAAVQFDKTKEVYALIYLIRICEAYNEIGYKDMDETVEPFYYDCPKRILGLLSPTKNEYALKWRAKCLEKASAGPSVAQRLNALPIGTTIKVNGKFYEKMPPMNRFKTPWYRNVKEFSYVPKKWIKSFEVVEVM